MRRYIVALLAWWVVGAASAEECNPLAAKLIVDAGWFFLSTDTRVRLDGHTSDEIGTDVNYENTFGMGDFDRARAEALWRIAPRHAVHVMYFENNRSATRSIERMVDFGEETSDSASTLKTRTNSTANCAGTTAAR
jgi:hypothetical protein